MNKKVDVTSTALEKGVDLAKGFIDRLVNPSIEELGLLVRDQVSFWRLSNQIKILSRAKVLCEESGISIKAISPKLLCPYLENASLEDDATLQEKWANLLISMVDSRKNVQNHVFPYVLSQLSKDEYLFLEKNFKEKIYRVTYLKEELKDLIEAKDLKANENKYKIERLSHQIDEKVKVVGRMYNQEVCRLRERKRSLEQELIIMESKEFSLRQRILTPQELPVGDLKGFEISNIVRLGLAAIDYFSVAGSHNIEVPICSDKEYASVDFDIDVETDKTIFLTELGELFIEACSERV